MASTGTGTNKEQFISPWRFGAVRVRSGPVTCDLFAFLTTEPSEPVKSVHPKAMPVILTEPDEIEMWMTARWEIAKELQRALPVDALVVIWAPTQLDGAHDTDRTRRRPGRYATGRCRQPRSDARPDHRRE